MQFAHHFREFGYKLVGMKSWLSAYFKFSRREYNGVLMLMVLIILITALPRIYYLAVPEQQADTLLYKREIQAFLAEQGLRDVDTSSYIKQKFQTKAPVLFPFDPNTLDAAGWQRLGLSLKQAMAVRKYVEKGGKFRKAEDLRKMYTINAERYAALLPYVRIAYQPEDRPLSVAAQGPVPEPPVLRIPVVVDINAADSATLCTIVGVGPTFARRIISYRDRLGGFYKKEQLMEVFGLDSLRYIGIAKQVLIDSGLLRKIDINSVPFELLKNHPYLRYKQANALIQFRTQHGAYRSAADLEKIVILNRDVISRILPYIRF